MTEQWPPEWEDLDNADPDNADLDNADPDTGDVETGDLAEVMSALASIPMPALPGAFEARISAAIAAEAATRTGHTGATGESATARSLSSSHGSFPRRHSRPHARRRYRLLSAPVLGSLVACLVFAGFGFLITLSSSGSSSSSAAAASGSETSHSSDGSPRSFAGSAADGRVPADQLPNGQKATFVVTESGTRYQPATLAGQLRARLADTASSAPAAPEPSASAAASAAASASASAPSVASLGTGRFVPSAALEGCVDGLTRGVPPSLVDRASYAGKPAYIIAVPGKAWVVGLGCTAADPELITTIALTDLSGNLCALGSVERRAILRKARAVTDVRDVIIIGSGPAGYTAAIYAARAKLVPLLFEGSVTAGGALMQTTDVENFPGFPDGIMGPDLMDHLRKQAERFGAELVSDDVIEVDLTVSPKVVKTESETYLAKAVIIATGSKYKELEIPGEKELSGHGVSWCATCDGFFFREQDIAVIGGGDSAVEEALFLTRFGKTVTLVVRRNKLRASKIMAERAAANPKIRFQWDSEPIAMVGEGKLCGLKVRNIHSGEETVLPVGGAFIAIGHLPRSELFVGQLPITHDGYLEVRGRSTRTAIEGVFACGDVVDHEYRQAITAAGSGCSAAIDAERWLAEHAS